MRKRRLIQDDDDEDDSAVDGYLKEIASATMTTSSTTKATPKSNSNKKPSTSASGKSAKSSEKNGGGGGPVKKQLTLSSFFGKKPDTTTTSAASVSKPSSSIPADTGSSSKLTKYASGLSSSPVSEKLVSSSQPERDNEGSKLKRVYSEMESVVESEKTTQSSPPAEQDSPGPVRKLQQRRTKRIIDDEDTEEDVDDDKDGDYAQEEDEPRPAQKKKKARTVIDEEDDDEDGNEERSNTKLTSVPRTEKFKYRANATAEVASPQEEDSKEKQAIRKRFMERFNLNERTLEEEAEEMPQNSDEDDGETTRGKKVATPAKRGGASAKKGVKYTPLEQQYLDIKKKHKDCLLVVEVGYKYRFFEEDALIAAKELNIVAYMDKNMYGASIPVHRLNVHVQKLVQNGYKVGIVRQMETAAIKASGDNKSAPFTRKLTNVYTKGTFVDDLSSEESAFESKSSFILCLNEEQSPLDEEKLVISFVAVQLSTGDIIHDSFEDTFMRKELETRLQHIQPAEILLSAKPLSSVTEKFIKNWTGRSGSNEDGIRTERLKDAFLDVSSARTQLTSFYAKLLRSETNSITLKDPGLYDKVLNLPGPVLVCLAALKSYLTEFGLEQALMLTKSFDSFASIGHMILSANTLMQLEIFQAENADRGDGSRGSLLWVMDHTITRFGARLLRRWIGRPLVKAETHSSADLNRDLRERVDAVEEVLESVRNQNPTILKLKALLTQLPDLEKNLARIHLGRCTPSELFAALTAFEKIASSFSSKGSYGFSSPILQGIFESLPSIRSEVQNFLLLMDPQAAKENKKADLFKDASLYPDITSLKEELEELGKQFNAELGDIKKVLKVQSLEYATVAGTDVSRSRRQPIVAKL
ncbi:Mismatch repair protein msh3 [Blyttiomyces sp. JEL0837]|nr:Mismatch repair protein msh3 [Blyttiomyces sp. JEL0837]